MQSKVVSTPAFIVSPVRGPGRGPGPAPSAALAVAILLPALAGVLDLHLFGPQRAGSDRRQGALPSSFALQHAALALSWGFTWLMHALSRGSSGLPDPATARPAAFLERYLLAAFVALAQALFWLAGLEGRYRDDGNPLLFCVLALPTLCLAGIGLSRIAIHPASRGQLVRLALATTVPLAAGPGLALGLHQGRPGWDDAGLAIVFWGLSLPLGLVLLIQVFCWSRQGDREASVTRKPQSMER